MTEPSKGTAAAAFKARLFSRMGLTEALAVALAVNMVATGCLTYRVMFRPEQPKVITVGVGQLTREYVSRLATSPSITPQEVELRTKLFMAVAQDAVKNASTQKGVIVMPRECVLAGEYADATTEVGRAVNEKLGKVAATGPAPSGVGTGQAGSGVGGQ